MNNTPDALEAAYAECLQTAASHYENFPVASILIPKRLRKPVSAIYTFARRADDLADEGDAPAEQRIAALKVMGTSLDAALNNNDIHAPLYLAVKHSIETHSLDPKLFHDLLSAFIQDTTKTRYKSFDEVLDYCRRSANPVGRLMLRLFKEDTEQNNTDSDLICSALQLINFMQDIQQDLIENDRIYFPLDEMQAAGVSIEALRNKSTEPHVVKFVREQTQRARDMMCKGAGLGNRLTGRFGLEIRAIIGGGLRIADALLAQGDDVYSRPRLTKRDKLGMLMDAALIRKTSC